MAANFTSLPFYYLFNHVYYRNITDWYMWFSIIWVLCVYIILDLKGCRSRRLIHFQRNPPKPRLWKMVAVLMSCMAQPPGWNTDRTAIYRYPNTRRGMRRGSIVPNTVRLRIWSLFTRRAKTNLSLKICQNLPVGPVSDGLVYIVTPKVMIVSR